MLYTTLQVEKVVQRLRTNCPWNGRQRPEELLTALEAEINELRYALHKGAIWEIREELGDTLFNLVAIAECFREQGMFTMADIDKEVCNKMISRHPYVFDGAPDPGPEQARLLWEGYKSEEAAKRQASRIGVSIVCEIYEVENTKLSNVDWLKEVLLHFSIAVGIQPNISSHLITINSAGNGNGSSIGFVVPPTNLLLQSFPSQNLALLQGFSDNEINPVKLYDCITTWFETQKIEMVLLDRGHQRL